MAFEAFGEGRMRRPVRCVIYTRQPVGTSDELSSCAIQREACAVFAASQGWIVENGRFDDVGFSGATLDRPGLQRLLGLLREDGADHILVHRLDRLSRRVADCVKLFDDFRRLRANLVIVTAPELGSAALDHFLLNIMASFAEFERETIAGRIAEARARLKWERKRLAGAVPHGYNANPRTKQFEPALAEAEAVQWVFAEAATGKRPSEIAGELTVVLLDSLCRLMRLLDRPREIGFLHGLIEREIIFRVLEGPGGARLRAMATLGDQSQRTAKVIARIKENYAKPLRVEELAGMGVSTLHHHFRALTAMSPLQSQKQIRLQESRARMSIQGLDAGSAALEVGYESASQFTREYKRLFGQAPMRDTRTLGSADPARAEALAAR